MTDTFFNINKKVQIFFRLNFSQTIYFPLNTLLFTLNCTIYNRSSFCSITRSFCHDFLFQLCELFFCHFVRFIEDLFDAHNFRNIKLQHILYAIFQCDYWTGTRCTRSLKIYSENYRILISWSKNDVYLAHLPAFSTVQCHLWMKWMLYHRRLLALLVEFGSQAILWSSLPFHHHLRRFLLKCRNSTESFSWIFTLESITT